MVLVHNQGSEVARMSWEAHNYEILPGQTVPLSAAAAQAFARRYENCKEVIAPSTAPAVPIKIVADAPSETPVTLDDGDEDGKSQGEQKKKKKFKRG